MNGLFGLQLKFQQNLKLIFKYCQANIQKGLSVSACFWQRTYCISECIVCVC